MPEDSHSLRWAIPVPAAITTVSLFFSNIALVLNCQFSQHELCFNDIYFCCVNYWSVCVSSCRWILCWGWILQSLEVERREVFSSSYILLLFSATEEPLKYFFLCCTDSSVLMPAVAWNFNLCSKESILFNLIWDFSFQEHSSAVFVFSSCY